MKIYYLKSLLKSLIFFCCIFLFIDAKGQIVHLENPSFEDEPRANKVPLGWKDCGFIFKGETPPDVHPCGAWQVNKSAKEGKTYLGMVVRENNTWEFISQQLDGHLKNNTKYSFEISICTAENYISATRKSILEGTKSNFTTPVKLRIWGGNELCMKNILLAESPLIKNYEWKLFQFMIEPQSDITWITLEAYYRDEKITRYNGNILIDNASAFTPISQTGSSQNPKKD